MYQSNRVLFIHLPILNQLELNNTILTKKINVNCSSHTWNEEYDAFYQRLEKWGVGELFSDQSEPVKRYLRAYIEDW